MSMLSRVGPIHRTVLKAFDRRNVSLGDSGPIVSFTFDDFPRTASSTGAAILEQFGARGTFYVAAGLANTSGELGDLFTAHDLHSLVERGHEIASHTFAHVSSQKVSLTAFCDEVQRGMKAVEQIATQCSRNFAYPYGEITLGAKKMLAPYVSSARSIIPGANGPLIDLNLLHANSIYGDGDTCSRISNLIAQNVMQRGWLIFYTHDVRPRPSAYGCTPKLFELAVREAARSGSRLLTVAETLSEIGAEATMPPLEEAYVGKGI